MHCRDRSSDKPPLAILLFLTVLNRGLLHKKGQTLKIIFHPFKRKSVEKSLAFHMQQSTAQYREK